MIMKAKDRKKNDGFTLIELMVTILIATIVLFGIGLVLADSHRGWRSMWERENEGIVPNAYVARKTFDRLVRQATIQGQKVDDDALKVIGYTSLMVYYYADPLTSPLPDRYATFRKEGSTLEVELGELENWEPKGDGATIALAEDVEAVRFTLEGAAIRMELTLKTTRQTMTITTCAYRYNGHNPT
jgi:type II secretory pathway component PulJ